MCAQICEETFLYEIANEFFIFYSLYGLPAVRVNERKQGTSREYKIGMRAGISKMASHH